MLSLNLWKHLFSAGEAEKLYRIPNGLKIRFQNFSAYPPARSEVRRVDLRLRIS